MRPWANPVFQEAVTIYWKEGQAYVSYLFYVGILGALQVLALVLPAGEARFWIGPAFLFKFSTVAALLLIVYLTLRFAGLEFLAWRFSPLRHWLEEERLGVVAVASGLLAILVVHGLILLFLAAPLLAWSGAIARAPLGDMASTLPMLFLYAVGYGIWGIVGLAMWERKPDSRRVFIRWIFVCFFLISGRLRSLGPDVESGGVSALSSRHSGNDHDLTCIGVWCGPHPWFTGPSRASFSPWAWHCWPGA